VSFTYFDRGRDVILTPESSAEWHANLKVRDEVIAHALRNVAQTGHACDVYEHDETTILYQGRPT
jgi:hypothetical protein